MHIYGRGIWGLELRCLIYLLQIFPLGIHLAHVLLSNFGAHSFYDFISLRTIVQVRL